MICSQKVDASRPHLSPAFGIIHMATNTPSHQFLFGLFDNQACRVAHLSSVSLTFDIVNHLYGL